MGPLLPISSNEILPAGDLFYPHSADVEPLKNPSMERIAVTIACITVGIFTCAVGASTGNPIAVGAGIILIATGAVLIMTSFPPKKEPTRSFTPPPTWIPPVVVSPIPQSVCQLPPPVLAAPPPPPYTPSAAPNHIPVGGGGTIFSPPSAPIFVTPLPTGNSSTPHDRVQVEDHKSISPQQTPPPLLSPPPISAPPPPTYLPPTPHARVQVEDHTSISPQQTPPPPASSSKPISAPLPRACPSPTPHARIQSRDKKGISAHQAQHALRTPPPTGEPTKQTSVPHFATPLSPPKAPPKNEHKRTRTGIGDKKTPGVETPSSSSPQTSQRVTVKKGH